jgi:hypothetical protein
MDRHGVATAAPVALRQVDQRLDYLYSLQPSGQASESEAFGQALSAMSIGRITDFVYAASTIPYGTRWV